MPLLRWNAERDRLDRRVAEDEADQERRRQQVEVGALEPDDAGAARPVRTAASDAARGRSSSPVAVGAAHMRHLRRMRPARPLLLDPGEAVDHRLAGAFRPRPLEEHRRDRIGADLVEFDPAATSGMNFAFGSASVNAFVGPSWKSGSANCAV